MTDRTVIWLRLRARSVILPVNSTELTDRAAKLSPAADTNSITPKALPSAFKNISFARGYYTNFEHDYLQKKIPTSIVKVFYFPTDAQ